MANSFINIWTTCIILILFIGKTFQSGFFELQILEITNVNNRLASGRCCGSTSSSSSNLYSSTFTPYLYKISSSSSSSDSSLICPQCNTAFRLCLKEYQNVVSSVATSDWQGCAYGNASTPILGASSFRLNDPHYNNGNITLPFSFRWTKSFTLILQALDITSSSDSGQLIEETTYSGVILPSLEWQTLEHKGKNARFTYRLRVLCDQNYYNSTCTTFCRPRDDNFGHHVCGTDGSKICMPGWQGPNCDKAICKPDCDPVYGSCSRPGECECRVGWQGPLCNACVPYPGCKHGSCIDKPWQCICDRNWGGILCDQDLNYCGTHEPCLHGGTCENTAPDKYRCTCADGLSGERCEIVEEPCAPHPCKNGGTCIAHVFASKYNDRGKTNETSEPRPVIRKMRGGSSMGKPQIRNLDRTVKGIPYAEPPRTTKEIINNYTCVCATGWEGPNCEVDIDECAIQPCENGGICIDLVGGFRCECPLEWTGDYCNTDVNECDSDMNPCINAKSCQNLPGSFECECKLGWTGKTCSKNIDDCQGKCENGATCIDLVNDYYCTCPIGFAGKNCSDNINECESNPCKNGGECIDLHGSYKCNCQFGYFGDNCEESTNYCEPSPCVVGKCINALNTFYCECPLGRAGPKCELFHTYCYGSECNGDNDICSSIPCKNGGTCKSAVNGFTCHCPYGWSGPNCTERTIGCTSKDCINDPTCILTDSGTKCAISPNMCESHPCHNGGTCEYGDGWFRCVCSKGFSGPDCRINVNECASSPCQGGGTCKDEIGYFTCICPAGRRGSQCEIILFDGNEMNACSNNTSISGKSSHRSDTSCNFCVCANGTPRCSDLWCGLENCFSPNGSNCGLQEVCVPLTQETCLSPPCTPRGDCRELEPSKRVAPPNYPADTTCWPNQIKLNEKCARISILLQTTALPKGTDVESVCHLIRVLLGMHTAKTAALHKVTRTVILCENKGGSKDTIEVAVFSQSSRSAHVADVLGEILSRRPPSLQLSSLFEHGELQIISSILEVRVETALVTSEPLRFNNSGFTLFIVCAVCLCIILITLFSMLLCRRRYHTETSHIPTVMDISRHEDEKSNNLQNEENFRRYANPLKGSTSSLKGAVELSLNQVSESSLQPRAGPSGLHRSQQYLSTCDVDYEVDSDTKTSVNKRASQILLQKTQNTEVKKNIMGVMESKDIDKMTLNRHNAASPPTASISESNLLTVHI